jgi:hypothetical protein
MSTRIVVVAAAALAAMLSSASWSNARAQAALSLKDCSAKYRAAQQAGTLNGMKWADFRKAQCGAGAAPPAAAGGAPAAPTAAAPAAGGGGAAVFPSAIDPKYSKEAAGRARMHTCRDQYNANKASNGNGGLTWIKKGGGYYSECNRRLKG